MVALLVALGTQQDEDEPGWHGNLSQVTKETGLGQTHKGYDGILQEIQLSYQDVRCLCSWGNLLGKVLIELLKYMINISCHLLDVIKLTVPPGAAILLQLTSLSG